MQKLRLGFARANSLRAAPATQLLIAASLALVVGASGHHWHKETVQTASALQEVTNSSPIQALNKVGSAVTSAIAQTPINTTREAELDDGQTFAEMLTDAGVADADANAAMNALSKVYDLRHLKAGQDVTLAFTRTDRLETFDGAVFQPEAIKEISVTRVGQGFTANVKNIPVVRQRLAAVGEIRSSLYEAGDKVGVPHAMMASLIHIYSHDIDFQRDIHPGDSFELLYDQPMTAQGKAVGEGSIIYAALHVGGKVKPIYRVTFSDNSVDYFDEKGQSIRRALLRTPVAAAHITSGFGMRMHPLLGYTKMHKGVDFGASIGTPIFAAGNGVIDKIGFVNGYGRYIRIRHNGQLGTAYAHMSRFASNMYQGARVNQGQVIGYVGMSGRATGPHLHFEVLINGLQVNPMSVNLPTGRTLDGKLLADFKQGQIRIRQEYADLVAKNAKTATTPVPAPKVGVIQASAAAPAFAIKQAPTCGLRGGC